MDIEYKGANCVVITTKKGVAVTDPKLSLVGLKDYSGKFEVQLATQPEFAVEGREGLTVNGPGEYETENFSIRAAAAQRHIDTPDQPKGATVIRIATTEVAIAVVGHITGDLSEEDLEALGIVDIVIIPVGGNGYTLDAHGAIKLIRQLDPRIVIPVHYDDPALKYEVPQAELEPFLKELGAVHETTPKLRLKGGAMPEALTVYEITRTS